MDTSRAVGGVPPAHPPPPSPSPGRVQGAAQRRTASHCGSEAGGFKDTKAAARHVGETFEKEDCCSHKMVEKSAAGSSAPHWRLLLSQIYLGVVVNLGGISAGANLGFSAVALPHMRHPNSTLPITEEEASWIAGVSALSTPLGCLLSGVLLDRLGRRHALLLQNAPALLGWLLIALPLYGAQGLAAVYCGRILTGLATGMSSVPATVYVAEVGVKQLRGMLVTGTSIAISLGILVVYVIGAALPSWRLVASLCAVVPVVAALAVYALVAESPVWLVGRGRVVEARAALIRTRLARRPSALDEELLAMVRERERASSSSTSPGGSSLAAALRDLRRPECWKPLLIMNAFFLFQQLSGVFVVIFYAVDMVVEAGIAVDPYVVTVMIGIARLFITLVTGFLSNKVGRRPLALTSGAGMTLCMLTLATHLLLQADSPGVAWRAWLPVAALVTFILTSTLGFLTLPWAMIGEMFPARFRGAAGGFTTCSAYVYSFAVVKMYPSMAHALSRHGVFFFYGAMSLLGTVFVALALPETQGRSLRQVEEYFRGGAVPDDRDETAQPNELRNLTADEKVNGSAKT